MAFTPKPLNLERRIATLLTSTGVAFEQRQAIDGLQADFVVRAPKGQQVILEAKSWSGRSADVNRAAKLLEHYKDIPGIAGTYLVLEGLEKSVPLRGVLSPADLAVQMPALLSNLPSSKGAQPDVVPPGRIVFAAMPFTSKYDDVFHVAIRYAAKAADAVALRVDLEDFSGDVVSRIQADIRRAAAVVADLSESRPNVLYELGFAHALTKPVVHICSTPLSEMPFDIRNWNALSYEHGRTHSLRRRLMKRLRALLGGNAA